MPSVHFQEPPKEGEVVKLIDKLAELEHRQWMQWAAKIMLEEPGLSPERRKRWEGFMVPYESLPEDWKEYDREWAKMMLAEIRCLIADDAEVVE